MTTAAIDDKDLLGWVTLGYQTT